MKKIYEVLKRNLLFQGIASNDFDRMMHCLAAKTANYKKDDIILLSGDTFNYAGLIVSGSARVIKEATDGNITIVANLASSEIFGAVFACAGITQSPVTIQAAADTEILFINYKRAITTCNAACPFHARLIENMLQLIARKNLLLNQKIEILSKRTTREKLWCFFDARRGAAKKFTVPFNREEMAKYLCVDRSALSNELCKMRDEGLINFQKNKFEILGTSQNPGWRAEKAR